ncbi:hypothetical protein [Bradyrhizobium liaoningense]|uniref:hypothetical protein n=1 Tax=Bradyrhizobium liaoningense TaxID=43992 RepID=UPI001BA99E83|nr:hypothetical protein [Bradyrhizobium liaoningense]MBR1170416.1 hypothetical protein [Bradyrhizobium liaoningense]
MKAVWLLNRRRPLAIFSFLGWPFFTHSTDGAGLFPTTVAQFKFDYSLFWSLGALNYLVQARAYEPMIAT